MVSINKAVQKTAIIPIRFYQKFISPMLGSNCRFYPSCSCYAVTAIERFGVIKGGWLAGKRILKCHPFHSGGIDPVPEQPLSK